MDTQNEQKERLPILPFLVTFSLYLKHLMIDSKYHTPTLFGNPHSFITSLLSFFSIFVAITFLGMIDHLKP